ncbi:MAG: hypothetical protein WBV60_12515, partial [Terriglobales bacterium]
ERNRVLRGLASRKKAAFLRSLVGTVVEAITLQSGGTDFTEALTDNYLKIKISGRHKANQWIDVKVEGAEGEMLVGTPVGRSGFSAASIDIDQLVTQECTPAKKRIDRQPFAGLR